MKRINDLHACLLISFIIHTGMVGSGMLHFDLPPKDKPFEVAFEVEEEILPEVFEVKEEKKIEQAAIDQEDLVEPIPDESITAVPEPVQENEALKKSLLRYQDSIKQKIQKEKQYPRWALRSRHEGSVRITFSVLSSGEVEGLQLLHSCGYDELDKEALDAVWRASPFLSFPEGIQDRSISFELDVIFRVDQRFGL